MVVWWYGGHKNKYRVYKIIRCFCFYRSQKSCFKILLLLYPIQGTNMPSKQNKLDAYLQEIEELENRLKLVGVKAIDQKELRSNNRNNNNNNNDNNINRNSNDIRQSWHNNDPDTNDYHNSPTTPVRRQQNTNVHLASMNRSSSKQQQHKQHHHRNHPNHTSTPIFMASQSLQDLELIMKEQKKTKRKIIRSTMKYSDSAPAIGIPDFIDSETKQRILQIQQQEERNKQKLNRKRLKTTKLSARMLAISQPASAVNYEEFKAKMEQRKHDPFLGSLKQVPKKLSEKQQIYFTNASKPKRPNTPYKSEFSNTGFGGAGSRFTSESEFNKTPGPNAYNVGKSSLDPSGGRISTANPKSELDWIFMNSPKTPGPSDYGAPDLPRKGGVKFSAENVPSELDLIFMNSPKTPGPSQYQDCLNTSSLSTRGCGKISDANVPGSIEQAINRTKDNPGPGRYMLPSTMVNHGGKFNDACPESYLATIIRVSSRTPGPNVYQGQDSTLSPSGGRISTAVVAGNIDAAVARTKDNPGPAKYTLPAFGTGVGGVKFSDAISKTMIEQVIFAKKEIPGPSVYQGQNSTLRTSGGRISIASPPGNIACAVAMTKDNPGPGQYKPENVDMSMVNTSYTKWWQN